MGMIEDRRAGMGGHFQDTELLCSIAPDAIIDTSRRESRGLECCIIKDAGLRLVDAWKNWCRTDALIGERDLASDRR